MNLRISEGQWRFRVTHEELELLLARSVITLSTPFGRYAIQGVKQEAPLGLVVTPDTWTLQVDESALMQFASLLPAREGMEHPVVVNGAQLTLVLEVDVRRKR